MPFDNWMTPPDWIELARKYMGSIDYDPASNFVAQRYVNANYWSCAPSEWDLVKNDFDNVIKDGLSTHWHGNVWCNPPYSAGNIDKFTDKLHDEWVNKSTVDRALYLVNSATDTNWYHMLLTHCTAALLVKGRIKFWKIFDGKAHATWEGEKSIARRKADPTIKAKVGNSPRYVNTLFCFTRCNDIDTFADVFGHKGKIIVCK